MDRVKRLRQGIDFDRLRLAQGRQAQCRDVADVIEMAVGEQNGRDTGFGRIHPADENRPGGFGRVLSKVADSSKIAMLREFLETNGAAIVFLIIVLLVLAELGMETPVVFVVIFILAACGITMFQCVALLERKYIFWASQDIAEQK